MADLSAAEVQQDEERGAEDAAGGEEGGALVELYLFGEDG